MQGTVHLCIEPPLRSAPLRSASLRAALLRSAPLRSAALRAAPAPLRCAPRRASARRPARLRSAPLRSAPTPLRSTPLRCGTICSELFSFPEAARPRKKVGTFLPVSLVTVHDARLRAFLSVAALPSVVACLRESVRRLSCGGWHAHTCSAGVCTQGVRWCWRTCCARDCALLCVRCLRHDFRTAPRHGWRKS